MNHTDHLNRQMNQDYNHHHGYGQQPQPQNGGYATNVGHVQQEQPVIFNESHIGLNSHYQNERHGGYANDVGYVQQEQPVIVNEDPIEQNSKYMNEPWFLQIKSHGKTCAIQAETSATKSDWHTVNIESAKKDPRDETGMKFDWKKKTMIQLTRNELPVFIAVLLGMLPGCKFANHGNANKYLEIENQGKCFYMKVGGTGIPMHTIPVPAVEGYQFATLALGQYVRNFDGLTADAAINIIERLANQLYNTNSYPGAQVKKA